MLPLPFQVRASTALLALATFLAAALALHVYSTGSDDLMLRLAHAATARLFGHPLAGLCGDRQVIKSFLDDMCTCRRPPFARQTPYHWVTSWEC